MMNPFFGTDGYKTGHHKMYPLGTTTVYSNFTPRSNRHGSYVIDVEGNPVTKIVSFGQQMVMIKIKEMFDEGFFNKNKEQVCSEIKKEYSLYLGEDYDVSHIEKLYDLGYLPINVKSLPEGTQVPIGVPVLTIYNTNPDFYWLTNFLETLISTMLWKPMTAATIAYSFKQKLMKWAKTTDKDNTAFVEFQGHNFAMRGMDGLESSMNAGLGHSISFLGDDSLTTIHGARKYYHEEGPVVHSVNATEHSVMCAGSKEGELETFRYLMKQFPKSILSIVSDTWNLWDVVGPGGYVEQLKEEILARDGKLVIRPDSGDPVDIICGNLEQHERETHLEILKGSDNPNLRPQHKGVIELLWDIFGGTTNEQGYKVLDPHIGAIYGDSITLDRAEEICARLEAKGFASTNVVLGIGSYTYQFNTRDTFGFAMKATYVEIQKGGYITDTVGARIGTDPYIEGREIFKDPITDDGTKKSAKGLLRVDQENGVYFLRDQCTWDLEKGGLLQTIFKDGEFFNQVKFSEIRQRLAS